MDQGITSQNILQLHLDTQMMESIWFFARFFLEDNTKVVVILGQISIQN